jgi:hypothetical protein
MLFGKKKTAPENPYYDASNPASQPQQPATDQMVPTTTQPEGQFPVPLLPAPEPITLPNMKIEPIRMGGNVSALDIMKMSTETKSFAFVKLSDFKRILDDIKALESRMNESQDDLEEFSKLLKEQEDYLNRYSSVIKDLKRTIEEIASSLSRVED